MNFKSWHIFFNGTYSYKKDNSPYSEETFEIFSHPDKQDLGFQTKSITRTVTGEILKITSQRVYTSLFQLKNIEVTRSMGAKESFEEFKFHQENSTLSYHFKNAFQNERETLNVSKQFHIQTPDALTSLVCTLFRKQSAGVTISQKIVYSNNFWKYEGPLVQKNIFLKRGEKGMNEEIKIKKNILSASRFTIFDDQEHEESGEAGVVFFLSSHYAIPYQIIAPDNTVIEINFLNDLRDSEKKY